MPSSHPSLGLSVFLPSSIRERVCHVREAAVFSYYASQQPPLQPGSHLPLSTPQPRVAQQIEADGGRRRARLPLSKRGARKWRGCYTQLATRLFFTAPQLIGRRPAPIIKCTRGHAPTRGRDFSLFSFFPSNLLQQLRRLQPACSSHFGLLVGHHNRLSWPMSPALLLLLLPSTTTLALSHA